VDVHVGVQIFAEERLPRVLLHHPGLEVFNIGNEGEVLLGWVGGRDGLGLVEGAEQVDLELMVTL
jgi:hypothetical protein